MALILNIDTSTELCSVAIARDGVVLVSKENTEGLNHSVLLGVYVDEALNACGIRVEDLDAVSVSMGPGSYTGLRIGISLAKGLCFGAGKPLLAISTLQALAVSVIANKPDHAYYCPMIDARRMEVYTALYGEDRKLIREVSAEVIDESSFIDVLSEHVIYFFGNGSEKVKNTITHPNARFIEHVTTSAVNMVSLSEQKWKEHAFEDVAYFEPFYLKDFIATTPKKKFF